MVEPRAWIKKISASLALPWRARKQRGVACQEDAAEGEDGKWKTSKWPNMKQFEQQEKKDWIKF